jgi:Holliday junction resolvase
VSRCATRDKTRFRMQGEDIKELSDFNEYFRLEPQMR